MHDRVKNGWARSSAELSGTDAFWERSAAVMAIGRALTRHLARHARGRLLDAGAGTLSARHRAVPFCAEYRSLDVQATHSDLDYRADIQRMPIPDGRFDTVLCLSVLEHVPDPAQALREIFRVLAPGGKLIAVVPHLAYLHNEPHDYYRFTHYGLRALLERAGFRILTLEPAGGFGSFLQHLAATVLVGLTYRIPLLWPMTFSCARLTSRVALWLDARTDRRKLFALCYVAVAEKP